MASDSLSVTVAKLTELNAAHLDAYHEWRTQVLEFGQSSTLLDAHWSGFIAGWRKGLADTEVAIRAEDKP